MNDLSLTFTCQVNPLPLQTAPRLLHDDTASLAVIAHGSSPDHQANTAPPSSDLDVWPFESVGEVSRRIISKIAAGWS
jgi:hypothetical protein